MSGQSDRKRLADVLPPEFMEALQASPARRYASGEVIQEYHVPEHPWPGPQKSVSTWYALANGKAVGMLQVGGRRSLPVIAFSPNASTVLLQFTSPSHQTLHQVLTDFGFSFTVSSQHTVGLEYRHPDKPVIVMLKPVEDELEYVCLKPDGSVYDQGDDYNMPEREYIFSHELSEQETLRRDLHVLVHVRPSQMTFAGV